MITNENVIIDFLNQQKAMLLSRKKEIVERLKIIVKGSVQAKKRGNKEFYYIAYRNKDKVKFKYLGKEYPTKTIELLKERKELGKEIHTINNLLYSIGVYKRIDYYSLAQRYTIFERDNFTCQYCGRNVKEDKVKLVIDHKVPKKRGGTDKFDNLITCCFDCNAGKRDRLDNT